MEEIWMQIDAWLMANAPALLTVLQPGASDAQIRDCEAFLSVQFPDDVKASYRIHNGQSSCEYGLIHGREFLSLERIKDEWRIWKELLDGGTFQTEDGHYQGSEPAPGIRNLWWSSKWIPLTHDGGGNHDCLDLDPAEGGTVGQIITMWHDDAERALVAPSFREWLKQYYEGIEAGLLVFSEAYNGIVSIDDV